MRSLRRLSKRVSGCRGRRTEDGGRRTVSERLEAFRKPSSALRPPTASELERHAGRRAPELEVADAERGDVVVASVEAAEVADVAAQADVLVEESHHAAAHVEAEVVLRPHVEHV